MKKTNTGPRAAGNCCKTLSPSNPIDGYVQKRINFRVRRLGDRFNLSSHDREDLNGDMVLEVLSAFERFDPELSQAHTFGNRVLDRFSLFWMRRKCTRARRKFASPMSFDGVSSGFEPSVNDPAIGEFDEQALHGFRLDLPGMIESLPNALQKTCQILLRTTGRAAAAELGMSKSTFYRRIAAIREHFAEKGYRGIFPDSWDTSAPAADVGSAVNKRLTGSITPTRKTQTNG